VSVPRPERVTLYDTTLRDGMQREGMSLSVGEQLDVALRLAALGIDVIEAGFPASNPKDHELFRLLEAEDLGAARVAAFGMTRRRDLAAPKDPALRVIAESFVPVATLVGKTWDLHLEKVIRVGREENLRLIEESVAFLVAEGKEVVYDAEHFFDAHAAHPGYALDCLRAAVDGGATWIVPCDTNGATLPARVAAAVAHVRRELPGARLGIHAHNDAECAVANSLAAVDEGARMVQGTVNGYGERCGNANLVSIIPSLVLKMGYDVLVPGALRTITPLSHAVAEIANLAPDDWAAYVGRNAFAHKGGMHVAGMLADERTFEHIAPDLVGNERHVLVSELSGRGTIVAKARELGVDLEADPALVQRILARLKELEHEGYHFEVADASFELLLEREMGVHTPLFTLESYRVSTEERGDGGAVTEATIRIHHDGERLLATAEGNGPVNALDRALRVALEPRIPELSAIELVNFTVRILDERAGTAATTRVLLTSSDGRESWGAIGVAENVIAASWQALVDSLDFGVRRVRAHAGAEAVPAGAG
jgi:2-isopropylmalate synthase